MVSLPWDTLSPRGSLGLGPAVPEKRWDLRGHSGTPREAPRAAIPAGTQLLFVMSP